MQGSINSPNSATHGRHLSNIGNPVHPISQDRVAAFHLTVVHPLDYRGASHTYKSGASSSGE